MRKYLRIAIEAAAWLLWMNSVADAGPLFAAISAFASFLGSSAIVKLVVGLALKIGLSLLQRASQAKQRPPGVKGDMQVGGDNPLSFIVGLYATAGQLEYANTWGDDANNPRSWLVQVISVSDIPVSGRTNTIWVNGEKCTISGDDDPGGKGFGVTEYFKDGKYYLWVRFHDGTETTPDAYCRTKFGGDPDVPYTDDMIGRGVAYFVITARLNRKLFNGFPKFKLEVNGIKLYNPAKDSTNGGSGLHRWTDPSTWEFTVNNAVIIYNIVRGIYYGDQWIYGGKNLPGIFLPASSWIAAINECDVAIGLAEGGTEPQYRAGYEINCDQSPLDVIDQFLDGCSGRMAEIGGYYKIQAGAPGAAVYSFTDGDILATEDLSLDPFPGIEATINGAHAVYPEPQEAWGNKDAPVYTVAGYEVADGGRELLANLTFNTTPYPTQVQRLMKAAVEANRRFRRHVVPLPPEAWLLEPNDVVSWTSTREGYSNKAFQIVAMTGKQGMIQLVSLQEIDPTDYDWVPGTDQKSYSVGYVGSVRPPIQTFTGIIVTAAFLADNDGTPRAPSIAITFPGQQDDVQSIHVQVKQAEAPDTSLVFDGFLPYGDPATNPDPITAILNGTFIGDTDYKVRIEPVPYSGRETGWIDWIDIHTDDIAQGDPNDLEHMNADIIQFYKDTSAALNDIRNRLAQLAFANAQAGGKITKMDSVAVRQGQANAAAFTELDAEITDINGQVTALASAVTGVTAAVGLLSADGLFQLIAEAGAGDVVAALKMQVRATTGDAWQDAGFIMQAGFTGGNPALPFSQILMKATQILMTDGVNTHAPFVYSGGVLKLNVADIQTVIAGLIQGPTSGLTIDINNEFIAIAVP